MEILSPKEEREQERYRERKRKEKVKEREKWGCRKKRGGGERMWCVGEVSNKWDEIGVGPTSHTHTSINIHICTPTCAKKNTNVIPLGQKINLLSQTKTQIGPKLPNYPL